VWCQRLAPRQERERAWHCLDLVGLAPRYADRVLALRGGGLAFINTGLFSLEKATRSSVVLGLVGAGGIGIELKVVMDMFHYDQAATILLLIFALVVVVEQISAAIRRQVISVGPNFARHDEA